jgi:hypothetical protein
METDGRSVLLTGPNTKIKARTVLNKAAEFAARNVFDGKPDTCYNSDQGTPQYLLLDLEKSVAVDKIEVMFQGGFVGQDVAIELGSSIDDLTVIGVWETIKYNNEQQSISLSRGEVNGRYLKLNIPRTTDFYGRVTIYSLAVYGEYVCQ